MVLPFPWKDGEGYDIHVLRGLFKSKSLLNGLQVDTTSPTALKPVFTPNFTAASSVLGVSVDSATGEVTATAQPPAQPHKYPNFSFLIKAHQAVGGVATFDTELRVHVHSFIKSVWLTPSTLTPHVGSNECRFTVLARFDDDTVGDITDWPASQLSFKSSLATAVAVLSGGILQAKVAGKTATITATLKPPTTKTATAQVFTKPSWGEVGKAATLEFVAGPVKPDPADLDSSNSSSVKSVAARTNILVIAEGFLAGQIDDFRHIVDVIVTTELQAQSNLEPFNLLANSINYWRVFVESQEEGTSVLGDQAVDPTTAIAVPIPLPRLPSPTGTQWTEPNLIHEGGLPLPNDPPVADPAAWVTNRNNIYTLPSGAPGSPAIAQADVDAWNGLRPRFVLNERNSAFGVAHFDRPKVSDQDSPDGLLLDPRRMKESSLESFLAALKFGKSAQGQVWGVGGNWVKSVADGKDAGLVCFVCRSDVRGGMLRPPALGPSVDYFTASTGDKDRVEVKVAGDGRDIVPPNSMAFSTPLVASLVAYGCGRAFGLGDEQGDGENNVPGPTANVRGENLQEERQIVTTTGGTRSIDVTKIAWLWPRITKAALVKLDLDIDGDVKTPENCDQNGHPNKTGAFLLVHLLSTPAKPFAVSDLVRLRGLRVRKSGDLEWHSPSLDDIAGFPLKIESVGTDTVVLSRQAPSPLQLGYEDPAPGTQLQPAMFKAVELCSLIVPKLAAGIENKLVSKPMLDQITLSDSPLNAPFHSQGQSCTRAPKARADVSATNLPAGFKPPPLPHKGDLIGIYDGGGHFDCGVFRPAGRCRMRRGTDATTPFCHVCCYVIVDRVDPTVHGLLDNQYDPHYPK